MTTTGSLFFRKRGSRKIVDQPGAVDVGHVPVGQNDIEFLGGGEHHSFGAA